jgi:hypothetical protein
MFNSTDSWHLRIAVEPELSLEKFCVRPGGRQEPKKFGAADEPYPETQCNYAATSQSLTHRMNWARKSNTRDRIEADVAPLRFIEQNSWWILLLRSVIVSNMERSYVASGRE